MAPRLPSLGGVTISKVSGQSWSGSVAVRVMTLAVSSSVLTALSSATGGLLVTVTLTVAVSSAVPASPSLIV